MIEMHEAGVTDETLGAVSSAASAALCHAKLTFASSQIVSRSFLINALWILIERMRLHSIHKLRRKPN
jgi:hypothetical protein